MNQYYYFRDLYEKLIDYSNSDMYPFHMPGHKRNRQFVDSTHQIDITEIPPFDDLHHPQDIVSGLSCDDGKFILVNGSTGGILAAIRTMTKPGDNVLIARNCHRSVYNAVELLGLKPHYIMPETARDDGKSLNFYGEINADEVDRMLNEYPDISLAVITSPTYEGMCSDTETIADICHAHGTKLFVDQAHGVHPTISKVFGCCSPRLFFAPPAEKADAFVTSLHKNSAALTQTAMLISNLDKEKTAQLRANLAVFQTSSPSYVLTASAGRALKMMESRNPAYRYALRLQKFYYDAKKLSKLKILFNYPLPEKAYLNYSELFSENHPLHEAGKVIISSSDTDISGYELANILREKYHIETEMATPDYVLAYTTVCDTDEGFIRLAKALKEIDSVVNSSAAVKADYLIKTVPKQIFIPYEKYKYKTKRLLLEEAVGKVAMETIMVYPPGIPCVAPGEVISREIINHARYIQRLGGHVYFDSYREHRADTVNVADL